MERADHFAIVIGLSSYTRLGNPPQHLRGPENDADAVYAWLTNPNEGGLPPTNVRRIVSRDWKSPPNPAPSRDQIAEAFIWLDNIAQKNQEDGKGRTVGARLYLYASGHGFSPKPNQGCLLAGNAAERQFSDNVFPSAWVEWMQDAGYFRECVLWMDACMDRVVITPPTPPPLDPVLSQVAPGPSFIAYAAPRPLKAIEKPIPDDNGKWHGIFTWNLLAGLRGAAANKFGVVTGKSLGDWLRHAQLGWLDDADRVNPDLAKEPAIVTDDESMIFARGVTAMPCDVVLKFPPNLDANQALLWSESPPRIMNTFNVLAAGNMFLLRPGMYLAEVPGAGLRQGFTVLRGGEIVLSEMSGLPGLPPDASRPAQFFELAVRPNDATAAIRVVGEYFSSADTGAGSLVTRLPFGLYEIRIQVGRQIAHKVLLLDRDWPSSGAAPAAAQGLPDLPRITSAAPLPDTRTTHEYHQAAVGNARGRVDVDLGPGAELLLMARGFSASGQSAPNAQPWDGVALLDDKDRVLADLASVGLKDRSGDPSATCMIRLPPATYTLRYPLENGSLVCQSLIVPQGGWRLEAYLLQRLDSDTDRVRITLLMQRTGPDANFFGNMHAGSLLEKARVALTDERAILNSELEDLLWFKYENPLTGIVGAHLLLMEEEKGGPSNLRKLNTIVRNLRDLVGNEHPDVEALSLVCPDPKLRRVLPFTSVPMFERSWQLMCNASEANPNLVPVWLWQRVFALSSSPPFLAWSSDPGVRYEFKESLMRAAFLPEDRASSAAAEMQLKPLGAARRGAMANDPAQFAREREPRLRPGVAKTLGLSSMAVAELWKDFVRRP